MPVLQSPWSVFKHLSWLSLAAMLGLAVTSVFAIYSATYRGEDLPNSPFYWQQIVWFAAGFVAFAAAIVVDYRQIAKWTWPLFIVCMIMLAGVLFVGVERYGARRWHGFKGFGIQPSEFAKIGVTFALAHFLSDPEREVRSFKTLVIAGLMSGSAMVLIMLEPDLGSALVLAPMTAAMLFVAGVQLRYFAAGLIAAALLGSVLLVNLHGYETTSHRLRDAAPNKAAYAQQVEDLGRKYILKPYQWERILVFLNPERDPYGWGWNLRQSQIAVGSGGVTGKGWLQGTQNVLGFLPRQVAPNDFIFSVIAEEGGYLTGVFVLICYAVLLLQGLWTALVARDRLGRLLATGITMMLLCHVFVNMGMTIGLVPITGVPLPLLSYGGSFVLSTMVALGILQNVRARRMTH